MHGIIERWDESDARQNDTFNIRVETINHRLRNFPPLRWRSNNRKGGMTMMKPRHNIIPHLWFDKEAKEAAEFYCAIFPDSRITNLTVLHDTPSGDCDVVSFELSGSSFMAISAGPLFTFNPSVSFIVNFDPSRDQSARQHLDELWEKLSQGGTALMPLEKYPFSERYGWIQDKYGLSWQLMLSNPGGEERPLIVPSLMFVGAVCGKAEEATDFYLSVFSSTVNPSSDGSNTKRGILVRYPKGAEPDKEGTIMFTDFMIGNEWFAAMDSAHKHNFAFNEAISFMVPCETQEEIDYFWQKLSAVPEAEQCGWLKDRYGLSWQISSTAMNEMMSHGTSEQIGRVTRAFLPMKKFDLAELKKAYEGTVTP
jgi:predicted 3-demethylubiquinone-9 3-methyltransferase (glyoxalase superfamily)